MIAVIDGPAGSGKSSTARAVADKLGIEYLDSGALYRAFTLMYVRAGEQPGKFFEWMKEQEVLFKYSDKAFYVWIDGEDVTGLLRTADIVQLVSQVASIPEVREHVNELMREAVKQGDYIAEGRDLGTAVFPDADVKFYMKADVDERARRRHLELQEQEIEMTLEEVRSNIVERDRKDSQRAADPLKQAPDAIVIDTTGLTFEQQVDKICLAISEQNEPKVSK